MSLCEEGTYTLETCHGKYFHFVHGPLDGITGRACPGKAASIMLGKYTTISFDIFCEGEYADEIFIRDANQQSEERETLHHIYELTDPVSGLYDYRGTEV